MLPVRWRVGQICPCTPAAYRAEREAGGLARKWISKDWKEARFWQEIEIRGGRGDRGVGLDTAVLEGLSEEVIFEKSPEGEARASHVAR